MGDVIIQIRSREAALRTLAILQARFPRTFSSLGEKRPVPLAIGIDRDLAARAPDISSCDLRSALDLYCSRREYIEALYEGRESGDPDGHAVGIVSAEEAAHAHRLLSESDFVVIRGANIFYWENEGERS